MARPSDNTATVQTTFALEQSTLEEIDALLPRLQPELMTRSEVLRKLVTMALPALRAELDK